MAIAAIDVDAQQTFTPLCPDELPVPEGDQIAAALNEQAELASWRILTKDAHPTNAVWVVDSHEKMLQPLPHPNADLTWVKHAVPGTQGFKVIPGLPEITGYDHVIWKGIEPDLHPYGACYHDLQERLSTGLIEWLKSKGVTTVLVGGLATDYCVKTTAIQLQATGAFKVIVNLAACRGIAVDTVASSCEEMRQAGIFVAENFSEVKSLCFDETLILP
ncbi:nicotinamidase [Photobacterium galatheae]|uniref:nicotinamidase n=1 Tax=Photobacterium galatheae TaxID=1654360 RepID=A0A066RKQ3_9GAMM|nr:nicotinamidase [Photobacterium galatheae]KDM89656.1 amidase [Photobacterium galatheae]MCM0151726.1 nicotinamidase [Photobacterium galatheae]